MWVVIIAVVVMVFNGDGDNNGSDGIGGDIGYDGRGGYWWL